MTVGGIPMSALVSSAAEPRLVIVALHGGAVTSSYYDYPEHPELSLLRSGAERGYTVIALDRPGYGASAGASRDALADAGTRTGLVFGAVDALLADAPEGAGVFLMAHSMGCVLAVQAAASARGRGLLGLEIAGTGQAPHPDAEFMAPLLRPDVPYPGPKGPPPGARLALAMWEPSGLYPPGGAEDLEITRAAPRYEGPDIRGWVDSLPRLAARIRVPVHYTLGDHERVWDPSPAAMKDTAALFTASPRVETLLQPGAAHNLSRCWSAASYHESVLAFASECVSRSTADGSR